MVKKIAIALLCTALSSSLYAGEFSSARGFVGLEVGAATIEADANNAFYRDQNHRGSDVEYGFRLGAQSDEWRTMFVFDYFDSSGDIRTEKGLLSLDYFLTSSDISDNVSFKPYIGVNIGYMNYESDRTLHMFSIDESGMLYGAQAGFVLGVTESIDLDLLYRYSLTDAKNTDHIGSFVFGINYLY